MSKTFLLFFEGDDADGFQVMKALRKIKGYHHVQDFPEGADIAALRDFAGRYGTHLPNCPNPYKRNCDCGFNQERAALNGIKTAPLQKDN